MELPFAEMGKAAGGAGLAGRSRAPSRVGEG